MVKLYNKCVPRITKVKDEKRDAYESAKYKVQSINS